MSAPPVPSPRPLARLVTLVALASLPALTTLPALGPPPALGATLPPAAGASSVTRPRTSLPVLEREVMCVTCKIPLNVAESPQADRERAFIQTLIDGGQDEAQIKRALVGQYGPAVLALPSASGFDLAAYLVPLAAVLGLLAVLILLLPRWRRPDRAAIYPSATPPPLDAADTARLDVDLARLDR